MGEKEQSFLSLLCCLKDMLSSGSMTPVFRLKKAKQNQPPLSGRQWRLSESRSKMGLPALHRHRTATTPRAPEPTQTRELGKSFCKKISRSGREAAAGRKHVGRRISEFHEKATELHREGGGGTNAEEERSSFKQEVPEIVTMSSNKMSQSTQTRGSRKEKYHWGQFHVNPTKI